MVKLSKQNLYVADTLQRTPLCSGHHFKIPIDVSPRSDLPIADTSTNVSKKKSYQKFLYILFQIVFHMFFKFFFDFILFLSQFTAFSGP